MFDKTPDSCAMGAVSITPADSDLTSNVRALYIGTGGHVRVTTANGDDVVFYNAASGTILPVTVKRVWTSTTTASNILGLS